MVVRMEGGNREVRMDTRDRKRWSGCEEVWRCALFHSDCRLSYNLFMGLGSWPSD